MNAWHQAQPLLPAIALIVAGILALLLDAFSSRTPRAALLTIGIGGSAAAAFTAIRLWDWPGEVTTLNGMVATDRLVVVGGVAIAAIAIISLLLAFDYFAGKEPGEFTALVLFAAAGMVGLLSSANLLMIFISLEILSLSLYVLCGFSARMGAGEASLKYFLLGAFSSAFFLYGLALTYGATGSISVRTLAVQLTHTQPNALLLAGVALLGVGFAFKIAAVPFHMWAPDVYQGAPAPVTAFMAAGTKVAAFVALIRVFDVAFQALTWNWSDALMLLAVLSMVGGAVLAIAQRDVKRLLAYSSVSHAGFILVGVSTGAIGIPAALFYLAAYAATAIGAFGVVMLIAQRQAEASGSDSFLGLGKRSPVLAGLLSLFLLSLAGIPPTAGFIAKVGVFSAAMQAGFTPVVIIAVLSSVVAAYAYLRVMVWMYFDGSPAGETGSEGLGLATGIAILVPAVLVVVLGVLPGILTTLLSHASVVVW